MTGPIPPVTPNDPSPTSAPDRETFLRIALAGAVPLAIGGPVAFGTPTAGAAPPLAFHGPDAVPVKLRINGTERTVALEPRVTLLDALREYRGLTGTKKGCNHGECGACTVHLDGRRVNACLVLAIVAAGREVTTIEHLGHPDQLHPMQQAFIDQDAFQCGFNLATIGGIIWGYGQAVLEESSVDPALGRFLSKNLAGVLLPVNADIPDIDVFFVEEHDPHASLTGARGIGELGAVGIAPAIVNAVYHATGKRMRDLPIRIERLLGER